ncbi:MAG: HIT domain-containing protein [Parcubacteria group bacterium]|nr:HIT domain-containing protein [Parcubacteria group bacterium]
MEDCIFCKISRHEIPAEIVAEDEAVVVFKDIHPKASVHWLAVPKKHISSLKEAAAEDWPVVLRVIQKAVKVAQDNNLAGYKLVFNVGREGGQIVDHLHLHLLAGEKIQLP